MNPVKALAAYTAKLNPDFVKEDITTSKAAMVDKFSAATVELVHIEDQVRVILGATVDPNVVMTVDYPFYYAYAKEVYKLQTRFGGGSALVAEVALLVAKWTARGLQESVLDEIRDTVFSIGEPTP